MQKYFRGGTREWLWIAAAILLLAAALLFPLGYALADSLSDEEERLLKAFREGEIIRIHIIANSDSEQDQAIKLSVRDTLIERFGAMLSDPECKDADTLYKKLSQNTDAMLETAKLCAKQNGFDGKITAETGLLQLPSKQYGSILLPEGNYRALRITLGSGNGQNWWCVLYPQLCLSLAQDEEAPETNLIWDAGRILQQWLLIK